MFGVRFVWQSNKYRNKCIEVQCNGNGVADNNNIQPAFYRRRRLAYMKLNRTTTI